jgi:hypothetical protein
MGSGPGLGVGQGMDWETASGERMNAGEEDENDEIPVAERPDQVPPQPPNI